MWRYLILYMFAGLSLRTDRCWFTVANTLEWEVLTMPPIVCGGNLTEPTGRLSTPGFTEGDNYPVDFDCRWLIIGEEGKFVVLDFLFMDLEDDALCNYDYVAVCDIINREYQVSDPESHLGIYCGPTPPAPIVSTSNIMFVFFVSDYSVTGLGFEAEYRSQESSGAKLCESIGGLEIIGSFGPSLSESDDLYENNYMCTWRIFASTTNPARTVQLYVTQMDIPSNENCELDYIEVFDTETSLGVFCGTFQPPVLNATSGLMNFNFVTDDTVRGKGFIAYYLVVDSDFLCGELLTQETGTIESVDRDSDGEYDSNVDCVWLIVAHIDQVVELKFESFELEHDPSCSYDYVAASEDIQDADREAFGPVCGEDKPQFRSRTNLLIVGFHSDQFEVFKGFEAKYMHLPKGQLCDLPKGQETIGSFRPSLGEWDDLYKNNYTCSWKILAPATNHARTIQLFITEMDIPSNDNCELDYIEVLDNETSLGVFCGTLQPPVLNANSGRMIVNFVTDESVTGRGFTAYYLVVESDFLCGELLTQATGTFESLDRDSDGLYDNDAVCIWLIVAPIDQVVELKFETFQLEYDSDCSYDYVAASEDLSDIDNAVFGPVCGEDKPAVFRSNTNLLIVRFYSDYTDGFEGFEAKYLHQPKGQSTDGEVEIQTEDTSVMDKISQTTTDDAAIYTTHELHSTALTEQSTQADPHTTTIQEDSKTPKTSQTSLKPAKGSASSTLDEELSTFEPGKANSIAEFRVISLIISSIVITLTVYFS